MSVAAGNGSGNPSGTGTTIVATPTAAAVGDMVFVNFGWAVASRVLNTVADALGNTWSVLSHPGATQSGGVGVSTITTGWSGGSNNVTGTLSGTAVGGRVWSSCVIPASFSPVIDQVIAGAVAASTAPSISPGSPLAQASETLILSSIGRQTGATIPTWVAPFQPSAGVNVLSSVNGSGTTTAGAAFLSFDNTSGTLPFPVGFTDGGGAANFGLGLIAVEVTPAALILSAPVATVAADGMLGAPSEQPHATLATVSAVGALPLPRLIASAPVATVVAVGFPGSIPTGSERFRTRFFRPVVETLSQKVEGWWRFA